MFRKLRLDGPLWLQKLPKWIPELHNLVELSLNGSCLTEDPMQFLKKLQQLLILDIRERVFEFLCLRFEDGGFQKLKELKIVSLYYLTEIIIEKGALPSLKFRRHRALKNITGIQYLEKLEVLQLQTMTDEFVNQISTNDWIMEHVPLVQNVFDAVLSTFVYEMFQLLLCFDI